MTNAARLYNHEILALQSGDMVAIDGKLGTVDKVEYIEQFRKVTVRFTYHDSTVLYGNRETLAS